MKTFAKLFACHTIAALLPGVLSLVLIAAPAAATTRTVINTFDLSGGQPAVGSLREKISLSVSGDVINFAPNVTGTITLNGGELTIARNLTIIGPRGGVTVSGNNASRVFNIVSGTVRIANLIISSGRAAGAAGVDGVVSQQNQNGTGGPGGAGQGGGILNASTLFLTNCTLRNNAAVGGRGGNGALNTPGTYAGDGGAGQGGGLANTGTVTLKGCTLSSNAASGGHGGDGSHNGNGGSGDGGGLYNSGTANLSNCTLTANSVRGGNSSKDNPYPGAAGDATGGGIANSGSLTLINCTLSDGSAVGGTGADGGSNLAAGADGGDALGGVLFQKASTGSTTVFNTIIAKGTVTAGAAGQTYQGNTQGIPGTAAGTDVYGSINSQGYNLIGRIDGSSGWKDTDLLGGTSDATKLNPNLGLLQDNGGLTPTMALLSGSAAINKGSDAVLTDPYNITTDQRGFARKIGAAVDIGAFELDLKQTSTTFLVTKISDGDDGTCGLYNCTLREAITAANENADVNTIKFKPGVRGTIVLNSGQLNIATPMSIVGPSARLLAVSGNNVSRVFNISGGPVVISGLTIRNGRVIGGEGFAGSPGNSGDNANGGGIYNLSTLTLTNCTLSGNAAVGGKGGDVGGTGGDGSGGAIYNVDTLTLNNCTLNGNAATGGAGGTSGSGFRGSGGTGQGGGVYNGGTLTITNCTFSGNSVSGGTGGGGAAPGAGGMGAGGGLNNTASATLASCTFSGNAALAGASSGGAAGTGNGGGLFDGFGGSGLRNTIVAGNAAPTGPDLSGAFVSNGYNLIGTGAGSTGFTNGTNNDKVGVTVAQLKLGPLANNGGFTNTRLLLPGSPAINTGGGTTPAKDQRGYGRTTLMDIGACEFNGVPPVAYRADALIKKDSEPITAFSANNVYQSVPYKTQIELQSTGAGVTAIYQVEIENDTNTARSFGVRASESTGSGWTVVYKTGTTNISTAIKSTAGYKTLIMEPGTSQVITIEVTPSGALAAGARKSSTVRAFLGGTDKVTRDAVQAVTTVAVSGAAS